jgi:hypothetical protein
VAVDLKTEEEVEKKRKSFIISTKDPTHQFVRFDQIKNLKSQIFLPAGRQEISNPSSNFKPLKPQTFLTFAHQKKWVPPMAGMIHEEYPEFLHYCSYRSRQIHPG